MNIGSLLIFQPERKLINSPKIRPFQFIDFWTDRKGIVLWVISCQEIRFEKEPEWGARRYKLFGIWW